MPRRPSSFRSFWSQLAADTRGISQTEYLVTVGVVGLALAAAFLIRGDQLFADYLNARNLFLVPAI